MFETKRTLRSFGVLVVFAACLLAAPQATAQFATETFWMPYTCYSGA